MRDLKADLDIMINFNVKFMTPNSDLEKIKNEHNRFCCQNGKVWLKQAIAEKERADKTEKLNEDLKFVLALADTERLGELESLVQELMEALEVVERFVDSVTETKGHQKLLDAIAFVRMVMPKAKEVLGNGSD